MIYDNQVSPIEYGHVLLIPEVLDCLSQRIDHESFLLAGQMAKEAADIPSSEWDTTAWVLLLLYISHLHFQAVYIFSYPIGLDIN